MATLEEENCQSERFHLTLNPSPTNLEESLLSRRSVQSQADSGLPTQLIPVAFRRVNHTFLYLYPRDK
jgi:hypothetical protein